MLSSGCAHVGAKSSPCWAMLVASWAHLGPRWPHVEPSWADLGPILGPCWAHVGPMFGGYVGPMLGICWGCSKWRSRGATGQWVRLVGTWVQFTGYMGAISWYSGATSGYIPTYWQSPMHTFADRFPYLSQLCRKNHCLKPNSRKFNLVHFALEAFSRRQKQSASNKQRYFQNASSRANSCWFWFGPCSNCFSSWFYTCCFIHCSFVHLFVFSFSF